MSCRATHILPVLLSLLLAGCFHQPTALERAHSFQPLATTTIGDLPLSEYMARRSVYLLCTASGDFVTEPAGRLALTNIEGGRNEVRLYTGTGVVLTRDGYLLTAAHCVATPNLVVVVPAAPVPSRAALRPRVVWIGRGGDPNLDLAVLKVDAELPACFDWAGEADLRRRARVALTGIDFTGDRLDVSQAAGRILDPAWKRPPRQAPPIRALSHDAPLRHGDSGGPLLTPDGRLVAVNVAVRLGLGPQFSVALRPNPRWIRTLIERDRAAQGAVACRDAADAGSR